MVTVIGKGVPNRLSAHACVGEVRGGPGDDSHYRFAQPSDCGEIGSEITGGPGDDYLWGTERHDLLRGGRGDDTMRGNQGGDTLVGGAGDDVSRGGPGFDSCSAETKATCEG